MRGAFVLGALLVAGCGSSSDATSGGDAGNGADATSGGDSSTVDGASDAGAADAASDATDAGARCTPMAWTTDQLEAIGDAPSLAIDAQGTLHVAFVTGFHGNVMYGKRPAGGGWTTEIVSSGQATTNTAIAVDVSGGVHMVFQTDTGTTDAFRYAYRPTSGTWTTELVRTPVNIGADQIVAIATDAQGKPHLAIEFSDTHVEVAHAEHALDGGWDIRVVDGLGSAAGGGPRIALSDAGVMLAYPVVNNNLRFAAQAPDGGFAVTKIPRNPEDVSLAIAGGAPHLVFDSFTGGSAGTLQHAIPDGDGGFTLDQAAVAGQSPGTCAFRCFPAYLNGLAIDPAGGLHASFAEVDDTSASNAYEVLLRYAYRAPGGTTWTNEYIDGQGAYAGVFNAIALDPLGGVHIVYTSGAANNTPPKLMHAYRCH